MTILSDEELELKDIGDKIKRNTDPCLPEKDRCYGRHIYACDCTERRKREQTIFLLSTIDSLKEEVKNAKIDAKILVDGGVSIVAQNEKLQAENERLKHSVSIAIERGDKEEERGERFEALLKEKGKEIDGHIADKRGYIRDLKEKDEVIEHLKNLAVLHNKRADDWFDKIREKDEEIENAHSIVESLNRVIGALKQKVEELELQLDEEKSYSESYLKVGKERYKKIQTQQALLSKHVEAVEPFKNCLKIMEEKSSLREPDELPMMGMGRSIHDVPTMGDLRNLADAYKEIEKELTE